MEFDRSQLMRGTIEGCILQLIGSRPTYGYDIVLRLQQYGFADVGEGTIYPLLLRLEKRGLLSATFQPSPLGPSRKYYALTPQGRELLENFIQSWRELTATVEAILKEDLS